MFTAGVVVAIIGFIILLGIIPAYKSSHPKKEHTPINWSIVATWAIGVVGALIMGFGMSKIMVENATQIISVYYDDEFVEILLKNEIQNTGISGVKIK